VGARLAGLEVLVAANHWRAAVETHRLNHPDTDHMLQDLQQADFHGWPDFDVLAGSPACQGHSLARGLDRPHHDAARSTAWAIIAAAEAKRPRYVAVENVPEFTRWRLYPQWRACLEILGYHVTEAVLDAADCGVPQHRRRLFVVGVRRDLAARPLTPATPHAHHVAARSIIDREGGSWAPVEKPGRSQRVLGQVRWGRRHLGPTFLVPYYSSGSGRTARSLDRPIGTITTRDRWALVDGGRMRMLTARECLRAQGFPEGYALPPQHKLALHLIGNAVPPPLAAAVLGTFVAHDASLLN
jgi:DNA (cytosine-5)-methyltransferase 1